MKHTQGPWAIRETATHITVVNGAGDAVFHDDKRIKGVISDARLIAAAPRLYAVCERLLEAVPYTSEYDMPLGLWDELRAALEEANGGAE